MNVLLDTHIILWAAANSEQLSQKARDFIMDPQNEIYYSVASIWEITIKHMAKSEQMKCSGEFLAENCDKHGYISLPIVKKHIQAKAEKLYFMTHDSLISHYKEDCVILV